jgi:hypothetical protein
VAFSLRLPLAAAVRVRTRTRNSTRRHCRLIPFSSPHTSRQARRGSGLVNGDTVGELACKHTDRRSRASRLSPGSIILSTGQLWNNFAGLVFASHWCLIIGVFCTLKRIIHTRQLRHIPQLFSTPTNQLLTSPPRLTALKNSTVPFLRCIFEWPRFANAFPQPCACNS